MGRGKVLIALGGNAIMGRDDLGTVEEQLNNIERTCSQLTRLAAEGWQLILTHGNGPQIGGLLLQQEAGSVQVPPQPLDVLGAMTQGQMGYMLQQKLAGALGRGGLKMPVVSLVTQVLVDKGDPELETPTKPIGPFYTAEEVAGLKREGVVYRGVRPGEGRIYRRVVPSPDPLCIVEAETIRRMVDLGLVVIACGGGGVPVVGGVGVGFVGVEAVIDKDLASERLAEVVKPDLLLILTDVEKVKLNYGKPDERNVDSMSLALAMKYLKEGHFLPGSMEPKIRACVRFLRFGGERAVITSLDKALEGVEGSGGTQIYRG